MADNDVERVWQLVEKISICMMATWDGNALHARPMGAYPDRDAHTIYFLTDVRQHKDDELRRYPQLVLAFADTGGQKYVSISGEAQVSNDRAKIKDLWSTPAKAWWESADDPNIRVLKVTPHDAEFWDSPGTVASYISMAAAATMGGRPKVGEARKVDVS
ncbi:MAG TPA: pyridoxamine 5'-phosphate oxidase family protein [Pseudolabrys sp.]|nr:pyridoxamine 5'-phosphate oxidase family protein [Pseudolabrys sp.]